MTEDQEANFELKGAHVLAIFVGAFAIIIGVNLFMAVSAVRTFPGLEVDSSYADSQDFDERRLAQDALGWQASVTVLGDQIRLDLVDVDGAPVAPAELEVLLTRPTSQVDDQLLVLVRDNGGFLADADLAPGRWRLRIVGVARDGTAYRHNLTFSVPAQ